MTQTHSYDKTCLCKTCKYRATQEELAREDASRIKRFVGNADSITNHIGNAAYSLTLFIKHLPALPYNLLNGVPWLNMVFMIIGGMFRIASTLLLKENDKTRMRYAIPSIFLGLSTIVFGIAGLVVFTLYTGLVLMAISAGIDLVTSLLETIKTSEDYFLASNKDQKLRLEHGLKISLRLPAVVINTAALIGCVLLLTMPYVGGAILIATAIASVAYIIADTHGVNPVKWLYKKFNPEYKEPVEELSSTAQLTTRMNKTPALKPVITTNSPWAPQRKPGIANLLTDAFNSLLSPLPRSTSDLPKSRPPRNSKWSPSPR